MYITYNKWELFSVITLQLIKNFKGLNFKDYWILAQYTCNFNFRVPYSIQQTSSWKTAFKAFSVYCIFLKNCIML